MVEYIRSNQATDSFTGEDDRRARRRESEYAQNRQFAVDDATRRGLRRILASGTTAPASASAPTGGVNLPSGSFSATEPQPTTPPQQPQPEIQPTIAPTPVPVQAPTQSPALISGGQPTGYDALDSRLPGLGPSASSGAGQDSLAGGAGYDLLAGVESGRRQMDPKTGGVITSPAGAQGVMQVMPTTGPEAAALAGVPWDETLFNDPGPAGEAYSIKLGDAYFEEMKRQFGGNIVLATAAYNAGPGRVRQYVNQGRPLPLETEAYLDKVFGPGTQGSAAPRGNARVDRGDLRQMVADRPSGMQQWGPLIEELSGADVPGGGEAALRLLGNAYGRDQRIEGEQLQLEQTFARDDDAMERLAMTALAHGDMDTFDYWSQKSGIQVPQQVLADKRQSALFARGALLAEQFYKADPQQAARFIQGYMQGGPQAGFAAAGAPTNNQRVTLRDVQVGDQRLIARIGQNGQSLGYVTGQDGQPVQSATGSRGGVGGAGQDASVKRRDYEALIPQLGEALARATVYGQNGLNPGERYLRAWLEEAPKMGIAVNQESLAEAKKTADLINQQLGAQVAVPASVSVTDPGVQAPDGFDVQPQDSRVWADGPDGSPYYTEDGGQTWFDESGSPYQPEVDIPGMLQ